MTDVRVRFTGLQASVVSVMVLYIVYFALLIPIEAYRPPEEGGITGWHALAMTIAILVTAVLVLYFRRMLKDADSETASEDDR